MFYPDFVFMKVRTGPTQSITMQLGMSEDII